MDGKIPLRTEVTNDIERINSSSNPYADVPYTLGSHTGVGNSDVT